jgi:hypothetical protein
MRLIIAVVLLLASLLLGACVSRTGAPETPSMTPARPEGAASPTVRAEPLPFPNESATPTAAGAQQPEPTAPAVLPGALYLIDARTAQLLRVEPDAQRVSQITFEDEPVLELAVAGEAGTLFYLVGDQEGVERTLYALDGAGRRMLMRGQIRDLAASPDGQRVAYRLEAPEPGLIVGQEQAPSGVWVSFAFGMRPSLVLADVPADNVYDEDPAWHYFPISWSPDGATLALYAYDADGPAIPGGELVLLGQDGQEVRGQTCCELPSWSADSGALHSAGGGPGPDVRYGLYRNDAQSGEETAVIAQDSDQVVPLVFAPRQLADGRLYTLVELAPTEGFSWDYPFRPALALVDPDGSLTPLSPPVPVPLAVLWADDGSGALVASYDPEQWEVEGLFWQPAAISPPVELPVTGATLAWVSAALTDGDCSMFTPLRYQEGAARQVDSSVRDLQARLAAQGFAAGSLDGLFGEQTRSAVAAFQRARGLEASGVVDCATWQALLQ